MERLNFDRYWTIWIFQWLDAEYKQHKKDMPNLLLYHFYVIVCFEHIVDCLATKLWFKVVVWPEYYRAPKVLSGCQSHSKTQPCTSEEIEYMRCLTLYHSWINAFINLCITLKTRYIKYKVYKAIWAYPEKHEDLKWIWFSWRIRILTIICSIILIHQFGVFRYWLLHERNQHLYILLS